jgi:hypothetical protein
MGWGTGDEEARARAGTITLAELESIDMTVEIAEIWLTFYREVKAANPDNPSAQGRMELMQHARDLLAGGS